MKTENNMISKWLEEHGDPGIEKFIDKNLQVTEKVRLALEAKGWKAADLAAAMGKSPSEVSKWLTGMHNLTLKSIVKMETALGIELFHTEPVKEYEYVFLGAVTGTQEHIAKAQAYKESVQSEVYEIAL